MVNKVAVIFPGIGYHKSKPLLYHSAKLAAHYDYKVKALEFSGFPQKLKGNREAMLASFRIATAQAEEQLRLIDFPAYDDIVFISKSIGTVAAAVYAQKHAVPARQLYFTPLEQTFSLITDGNGIVFHGANDTWVNGDVVSRFCNEKDLELHIIKDVSHSLENDDVFTNLRDLNEIMTIVDRFLAPT